ncbi:hypothetical protein QE382_002140 [Sphingobacterium zeae]|uniref:DUF3168 domain-containing protein n=1 Tax=Sphingobacterium zeae TaxID=1776859 RepID=A0ABU0U5B7_9SPHI|nr:hypothetical protein [Sphingobacterium zeae]MDQ1150156.1 hypothetical protein [Sphingobacterium zeae]
MINVNQFKQLCADIVPAVGINGYVMASTYEQGTKKLKDKAGLILVGVYPAYHFEGNVDGSSTVNEMLLYIVTRQIEGGSDDQEIKQYADTLEAMIKLKDYLFGTKENSYCQRFPRIDAESLQIDPEYNIFGGYIGYSIKFTC